MIANRSFAYPKDDAGDARWEDRVIGQRIEAF
jgi:hypothetical protein